MIIYIYIYILYVSEYIICLYIHIHAHTHTQMLDMSFICLLQAAGQIHIQTMHTDTTAITCSTVGGFDPEPEPQTLPGQANVLAVSDPGAGG